MHVTTSKELLSDVFNSDINTCNNVLDEIIYNDEFAKEVGIENRQDEFYGILKLDENE